MKFDVAYRTVDITSSDAEKIAQDVSNMLSFGWSLVRAVSVMSQVHYILKRAVKEV